MESFISWCDDMTIADESLKDKIKEFRNVNLNAAVVANNIKDVKKFTFELKPLIQIPSDMQSEIKKKIAIGRLSIIANTALASYGILNMKCISGGISAVAALCGATAGTGLAANAFSNGNLHSYKLYQANNGKMYLVYILKKVVENISTK